MKNPPKWMMWIVKAYCKPEILEDLLGDLCECYNVHLEKGKLYADLTFLVDVFRFCRIYTIKKPKFLQHMTFFYLLRNYSKASFRSLWRNKLFSSINIAGLAVAMSVGILMITYLNELHSFDRFHENHDRIYRITSIYTNKTKGYDMNLASTSISIGKKLRDEYSGLDKVAIFRGYFGADMVKGENIVPVKGHYVSADFFSLFTFQPISGNLKTAFDSPYSLVLTKTTAEKLFDQSEDPVGKILQAGEKQYTITAVIEDAPPNSHFQFEALASFVTLDSKYKDQESSFFYAWNNIWSNYVYVMLNPDESPESVQSYLDGVANTENANFDQFAIHFDLEKLTDIVPGGRKNNQIGTIINKEDVYQLLILTLIVMISACFNYANLSLARIFRRSKEVGIRKTIGANRAQVFSQFIFEAVVISCLSLLLAYGIYILIRPEFLRSVVDAEGIRMVFQWSNLIYFIAFAVLIGLISGSLPSVVLSKLKAITIMGDVTRLKIVKGLNIRRVLLVLQFTISMSLIIGASIAYKQYNFSLNYDLGFQTENILNIQLSGNDSELMMTEFEKISEVQQTSRSTIIPSTGTVLTADLKYKDPLDSIPIYYNRIDKSYTALHQLQFVAGGDFPFDVGDDSPKFIIIDESLARDIGFSETRNAVGEVVEADGVPLEISGVIKDYRYAHLESDAGASALIQGSEEDFEYINAVVNTADIKRLFTNLESSWKSIDTVHPFQARFFSEKLKDSYAHYSAMYKLFTFLGVLAIAISCMGLLGMAVYTTETRMKEISIRKILGARESALLLLLSKNFMILLLVAAAISMPLTYYFFTSHFLSSFTERITISPFLLLSGVVAIFLVSMLTIGWQTARAARTNPAEMLRNE